MSSVSGGPWGLVVALGAFLLYLDTLAPSVVPYSYPDARDPGVLQIKAALLAVPDVTGYPTWVVLTHLFTYLPFGDEAYRANLASAAYAAVAVLFVYLVGLRLTRRVVPSGVGAILFATSQTFWSQAAMAEVYTLHALFVALVIYVLLVWRDGGRDRHLLAAFLMGLSLTHHLTSGLLVPAGLLLVALAAPRTLLRWRLGLKCASLFLLGLTPYLFLPIRASMNPPFSGADPTSLRGFYELVSGAGFKSAMFAFGPGELPGRIGLYLGHLVEQFHPIFLAVAMFGIVALLLEGDRATLIFTGFLYAGWLFYALEYDIGDIEPYFIPTHLLVCLWAAVGVGALLRWVEGAAASPRGLPGTARGAVAVLLPAVVLALPFLGVGGERHGAVDRSGEYEGRRVIEVVEDEVRRGAVVMQHRSPLLYMQQVERRRMDLTVSSSPFRRLSGEMQGLGALEGYLREGKSVYALDPHPEAVHLWERDGYSLTPVSVGVGLYEISE